MLKRRKIEARGTIIKHQEIRTGLALAPVVKGYKLICVTTQKQSKEKVDILKAMGSKVVVCPTNVAQMILNPIILQ